MENRGKEHTLVVKHKRVPVTKEVYKAYYREREHASYLKGLSKENEISLEECEETGIQADYIATCNTNSLEDEVIRRDTLERMRSALKSLSEQERWIIVELFYNGKSERDLSAETGIPQKTINDRKHSVLKKLKKIIES